MRQVFIILVLLVPVAAVDAAEKPSLAVMEITAEPDPDWREQDLRVVESLRRALSERAEIVTLSKHDVAELFSEPADEAWEPLAKRAGEHLEQGQDYYMRLKPRKAIKELSEALRILRAIFPGLEDMSSLERAHLLRGMTYQALGRDRQAEREYRMVLLLNPDRQLDDTKVNPVAVERFGKVRQRLQTSVKGSISLLSKPAGARVFMDGKQVGYTPVTIPGVYPGEHYFSMRLGGYKTWFGILRLKPGGLEKREVFLQEGQRIGRVRLRNRMARAGIGKINVGDAQKLSRELGADWLLFVSLSHVGGTTMMELGIFESGSGEVSPLGIFTTEKGLSGLAARVARWTMGERDLPRQTTLVRKVDKPPPPGTDGGTPPPPPPVDGTTAWYESWWFWTTVGVVVAGAAATSAVLLAPRDSGIEMKVYR